MLCSRYDLQRLQPEREGCLEHCSCKGIALCCILTAGRPSHAALCCASRTNLSGHFVLLAGSAS